MKISMKKVNPVAVYDAVSRYIDGVVERTDRSFSKQSIVSDKLVLTRREISLLCAYAPRDFVNNFFKNSIGIQMNFVGLPARKVKQAVIQAFNENNPALVFSMVEEYLDNTSFPSYELCQLLKIKMIEFLKALDKEGYLLSTIENYIG